MGRTSSRLLTRDLSSVDSRRMPWSGFTPDDLGVSLHGYWVRLDWTPCGYGGHRAWFLCPSCGKRVAILYLSDGLACRHCLQLDYASQRESKTDRALRRYNKIRRKFGWSPGFLNGTGIKPRFMHWSTFYRLMAKHNAAVNESVAGFARLRGLKLPAR